jgi:lysophospholipase L1-like esterase
MALENAGTSTVTLHNSSCSGKTIDWAARYITPLVVPNAPDLVIIDMGMNDIWGLTSPADFRRDMQRCIDSVRVHLPTTEFLILTSMIPDTTGAGAPTNGAAILRSFLPELRALESLEGVAVLDMTTLSEALFARKGIRSCVSNVLHPNDYTARWYAQALLTFITTATTSADSDTPAPRSSLHVQQRGDAVVVYGVTVGAPVDVLVFDVLGHLIQEHRVIGDDHTATVTLSNTGSGPYFIVARSEEMRTSAVILR